MNHELLKIKAEVPMEVFDSPKIKERVNELFIEMEESIQNHFNEIKTCLTDRSDCSDYSVISYDAIIGRFKIGFYEQIANMAVKEIFVEKEKHNLETIILNLLSKENVKAVISGDTIINAFSEIIYTAYSN